MGTSGIDIGIRVVSNEGRSLPETNQPQIEASARQRKYALHQSGRSPQTQRRAESRYRAHAHFLASDLRAVGERRL